MKDCLKYKQFLDSLTPLEFFEEQRQKKAERQVCVCVCARARACVCMCVCVFARVRRRVSDSGAPGVCVHACALARVCTGEWRVMMYFSATQACFHRRACARTRARAHTYAILSWTHVRTRTRTHLRHTNTQYARSCPQTAGANQPARTHARAHVHTPPIRTFRPADGRSESTVG